MSLYKLVRPIFFAMDPERAHDIALKGLNWLYKLGVLKLLPAPVFAPNEWEYVSPTQSDWRQA